MHPRWLGLAAILAAGSSVPGPAAAADFGGAKWTYERLFKDADVVVIAALDSTRETDEVLKVPDSEFEVRVVVSKLDCLCVLKGEVKDKGMEFRYWHPKRGTAIDSIPAPVRLAKRKSYAQDDAMIASELHYLLFLRRAKDGRFEAVSGIIGSKYSVREVIRPPSGNLVGADEGK